MSQSKDLTLRNQPIISPEIQHQIGQTRVLFAGCGLGSCVAESFSRLGLKKFILIDNDRIEPHNLNRQSFDFSHIGEQKVIALKERLLAINPDCETDVFVDFLNGENAKEVVASCDLIVDTIDFLDLSAVVLLHDEAQVQRKPIISVFTAGWGAVGIFIPPDKKGPSWVREIFQVQSQDKDAMSYRTSFTAFFAKIRIQLDPSVGLIMDEVFKKMMDNKPCPAPNVIGGAQSAAIIAQKFFVDFLAGRPSPVAPEFVYLDLEKIFKNSILKVF